MSATAMLIGYDRLQMSPEHGRIVHEVEFNNIWVRLYQTKARKTQTFAVQYGRQFDYALTYAEAAKKYGEAVMHALACNGKLDNNRD